MVFLTGSANRDDRRYPDGDRFDIHREFERLLTFGYGIHFCMGAALARLEGRIVLDELLNRFPEWDVDLANAKLSPTSTVEDGNSFRCPHPDRTVATKPNTEPGAGTASEGSERARNRRVAPTTVLAGESRPGRRGTGSSRPDPSSSIDRPSVTGGA